MKIILNSIYLFISLSLSPWSDFFFFLLLLPPSVCLQAQRTSAALLPEGRVLGDSEPCHLRPAGRGAAELRGGQPVAQQLAAPLLHPANGEVQLPRGALPSAFPVWRCLHCGVTLLQDLMTFTSKAEEDQLIAATKQVRI